MLYVQAQPKNFASIKDPKEISLLLKNIEAYDGGLVVRTVLRIAPYVFVRPGELRHTQWDEFDFEKQEWRIPAKKMKMCQVDIVPLAQQVIKILKELQSFTGHTEYLFPSMWSICRPISDVTLLAGLRHMGYTKEQMTVHGFRSMASTLLNEQGYNRDWIERQLAHGGGGERNNIRSAYNYAEYLQERRSMMQEWADYLDTLKNLGRYSSLIKNLKIKLVNMKNIIIGWENIYHSHLIDILTLYTFLDENTIVIGEKIYRYFKLVHEGTLLKKIQIIKGNIIDLENYIKNYESERKNYHFSCNEEGEIIYEKKLQLIL